ncbi:MAG: Panacea domain-containing protein [Planctomycetota bacterium]
MKLSYLIDLVSIKKNGKQIADFKYRRYNYGPFDDSIYSDLTNLVNAKVITQASEYTPMGEEFITYKLNNEAFESDRLSDEEKEVIDEVLNELNGLGAKTLTEIAYQTKPMKALKATIGGNEHLNAKLDLKLK